MRGRWKRGRVGRVLHCQPKGTATAGPDRHDRASALLYCGGYGTRRPGRFTEGTDPKGAAPAMGAMATAGEARICLPLHDPTERQAETIHRRPASGPCDSRASTRVLHPPLLPCPRSKSSDVLRGRHVSVCLLRDADRPHAGALEKRGPAGDSPASPPGCVARSRALPSVTDWVGTQPILPGRSPGPPPSLSRGPPPCRPSRPASGTGADTRA